MIPQQFCPLCQGLIEHGQTTFTVDFGDGVIVVREVPAQVCRLCGADWLEDQVAAALEGIVNTARRRRLTVEVLSWQHTRLASA
jgi:YgiT-type zinc finger domain-containing protein